MSVITVAGGGSGYTPGILLTALKFKKEFPISEVRLYDIDHERNADMGIIMNYLFEKNHEQIKLVVTEDPQVAFTGCDFVFSQIRVGGMKMREKDEKIPMKYGLVGQETCGVGGFSYGMRSMKGFLKLVGFIEKYAPDCWILNYTNPETIIAESVRRQFPKIKIVNACDMTIGIEELLEESFGYDRNNFICQYYGLNHFGWYREIYDVSRGKDILPEIIEKIKTQGFKLDGMDPSWAHTYGVMADMVREFFPQYLPNNYLQYYLYQDRAMEKEDPNYTRANEIMDGRLKKIKDTVAKIKENRDLETIDYESESHGQYIVQIAISILHNQNGRFMLIVPNKGAIPNLRQDAVVEVPCYVNARGIEPISLRYDIPDLHKGLMEAQVASEKLLVDAFFEHSYQKALEAFTLNQTVPNATVAKKALNDLIEANGDYWVELN
ncbi:6-phospho-alpha-glucosidase [Xylocopilactobacillus apicola]|uniref:Maltose-6'-phosphate glucosidase n=1 Tax=Xylocopilactobacillus apicola TaxID=2932184 RepID=A0AAU9D2P3_9LACO|nr:6-phospho-alpha-glucosidase [Xylocopilactobacillus apicola]BDR57733.1 maltose-6'-phosphate glucosidase [Xylocopilactobacillus apicola]